MPPSTFASAAAGGNSTPVSRPDGTNDWSRRTNGTTQTFRRPSQAATNSGSAHLRDASLDSQPARYVPPHKNGALPETTTRYSKEQLLDLARAQLESGSLQRDSLIGVDGTSWGREGPDGHDAGSSWSRRDDQGGVDAYWQGDGGVVPRGLVDLTDDERDIFGTSVNTTVKPMNASNREVSGSLRKISVSHNPNSPGGFGMNSPTAARAGGRRREPSESYPFPTNPLASPKPREESRTTSPPPFLRRRTTDLRSASGLKEEAAEESRPEEPSSAKPTNPLSSINTTIGSLGGPSSPWSAIQPSPGFAPMGAFGSLGASTPSEKRPGFAGSRAESRFKGLMTRDSHDEIRQAAKDKLPSSQSGPPADDSTWRNGRSEGPGGFHEANGQEQQQAQRGGLLGLGTPQKQDRPGDFGLGAFGMTPDNGLKGLAQDSPFGQSARQVPNTMSPSTTNPYQSPSQNNEQEEVQRHEQPPQNVHLPGLGGLMGDDFGAIGGGFNTFQHGYPGDRSQTSSAGPRGGFPTLGSLGPLPGLGGGLTGWGGMSNASTLPIRDRGFHGGFGESGLGGGDLQSPGLAGLGPSSLFNAAQNTAPGSGRGLSRMGSLFGQTGAEQNRGENRHTEPQDDDNRQVPTTFGDSGEQTTMQPGSDSYGEDSRQQAAGGQTAAAQANTKLPPAQQRTMVMPDRMRWIYRDPQGNTQGPWSGLEMHDWYKAGFFSPELLVKKFEDSEYEPLVQLIRRIGNSREPFLVPQIGIPHGQPQTNWGTPLPAGASQPPFAASFPSFGTTLTAEQQNALERRKQEEQYLMARQKEHLAQQQMAQRMQGPGAMAPHSLQHHPSIPSLHSQPSLGSLGQAQALSTAGSQLPQQQQQHGQPGTMSDSLHLQNRHLGPVQEESRPFHGAIGNATQRKGQSEDDYGEQYEFEDGQHQQQIASMLESRAWLQQEQAQSDALQQQQDDEQLQHNERLEEFKRFQAADRAELSQDNVQPEKDSHVNLRAQNRDFQGLRTPTKETKTLTEQVQQAVSAQQSPAQASPWAKIDSTLPHPFPPAPSQSPLPAPAAQRNRSHVADALHAESHSRSETPSAETPTASIAPWAKETVEAPKGPSLKQIQEAEALRAAKAEAIAAEARKVALEREHLAQLQAAALTAATATAGLPSSSTWATTPSAAASPTLGSNSAWAKATKPAATPSAAKSMAQIQKEEENRKKRLAAAALAAQQQAAALTGVSTQMTGKRYAELASKVSSPAFAASPSSAAGASAWTTVGASGKVKTPAAGVVPAAPVRSVSTSTPSAVTAVKKPTIARAPTTGASAILSAQEEFKRWAANELRSDLNKGVNAEDFIANLLAFPPETDILTEAVHSVSNTIDSRHFAEEFLRRRKLADKGVVPDSSTPGGSGAFGATGTGSRGLGSDGSRGAGANGSGWSEVAKKSGKESATAGTKDELGGQFKVVAAKKKAGKR